MPRDDVGRDDVGRIEDSLVTLVRRANDPRGNRQINEVAGVEVDRASAVMLARISELEPARVSVLARAAGVDLSTASRQVGRLVDDGLVERATDPTDRRASTHRLTASGRALHRRLAEGRRVVIGAALDGFSAVERTQFATLLERFVANISPPDGV